MQGEQFFICYLCMFGLTLWMNLCSDKALRGGKLIMNKHIKYNEQCLIIVKKNQAFRIIEIK